MVVIPRTAAATAAGASWRTFGATGTVFQLNVMAMVATVLVLVTAQLTALVSVTITLLVVGTALCVLFCFTLRPVKG